MILLRPWRSENIFVVPLHLSNSLAEYSLDSKFCFQYYKNIYYFPFSNVASKKSDILIHSLCGWAAFLRIFSLPLEFLNFIKISLSIHVFYISPLYPHSPYSLPISVFLWRFSLVFFIYHLPSINFFSPAGTRII